MAGLRERRDVPSLVLVPFYVASGLLVTVLLADRVFTDRGFREATVVVGWVWAAAAAAVFLMASPRDLQGTPARIPRHWVYAGLGAALLAAFLLRVASYRHADVPLGYDYGFYRVALDTYGQAAPDVPLSAGAGGWITAMFEPGLLLWHELMAVVAGLDAHEHLRLLYPVVSALLALPAFVAVRAYFGDGAGLVAAGLVAVAYAPFLTFIQLYEKNILALFLLLVLLALLRRERWVAALVMAGGLAVWHRPTALVAAAAFAAAAARDLIVNRAWKRWAVVVGAGAAAAIALAVLFPATFLQVGLSALQGAGRNIAEGSDARSGGNFVSLQRYQDLAVPYLALAGAAIALLWRRRHGAAVVPIVAFVLLAANVAFEVLFFRRFIIMLDVVAIVLAAGALLWAIPLRSPSAKAVAAVALVLLVGAPAIGKAVDPPTKPQLYVTRSQLAAVDWMRDNLPANATILAGNEAAPYVAADSGHRTFGPLMFGDPRGQAQWDQFIRNWRNDTLTRRFLSVYGPDLYVAEFWGHGKRCFLVERRGGVPSCESELTPAVKQALANGTAMERWVSVRIRPLEPPLFAKVHDQGGVAVYRFDGYNPKWGPKNPFPPWPS